MGVVDRFFLELVELVLCLVLALFDLFFAILRLSLEVNATLPMHSSDSYRSEMAGLLAGMNLLHQLKKKTGKSTRVTMSCDNDAALRVST